MVSSPVAGKSMSCDDTAWVTGAVADADMLESLLGFAAATNELLRCCMIPPAPPPPRVLSCLACDAIDTSVDAAAAVVVVDVDVSGYNRFLLYY